MYRLRYLCGALIVALALQSGVSRADDEPKSAVDSLAKAMKLYDAGDFAGADRVLRDIDESQLTEEVDQLHFQKYKSDVRTALDAVAAAQRDFAAGDTALADGRFEDARTSFREVVSNRFAADELKGRAQAKIAESDRREAEASSPPVSEVRRIVVDERPPAASGNLVDQLAEEHALLWQQAVTTYHDLESKIRKAVIENRYAEARRLMDRAKDVIRSNRRYASPPAAYDDYWNQAQELEHFVLDQERSWNEAEVGRKHNEIEERERQRILEAEAARKRQIDQLMAQAAELRKEQRYEEAITVLKEVLALDPTNDAAAMQKETLEDVAVHTRNRDAVETRAGESQDLMVEAEEALIPWHKDLLYPKNWPEISAKRVSAEEVTDSAENRSTRRKLEETAPEIKFDSIAFEQVIDYLRDVTGLNIVVNWSALEFADIEREAEVTLRLQNVKFSKALDEILRTVGGGETELAYEIDAGVITISTKEDLSRRTKIQVYNVEDLLHTVPNFVGRTINLDQIGQNQGGGGGGGGGAGGGFGGLGGSGGGGGGGLFGGGGAGGGGEEQQGNQEDPLQRLIELIQATIDPESWREAGGNVGTIQTLNNQIIITQTSTAHTQLRDLLKQLREARALQIAIEVRYLTITRNYLEQIGVDLDMVLNNGNAGFDRAGFAATPLRDPATGALVLVPRQFSRLGFTPGAPGGVGLGMPIQGFPQPFGQPGLVPAVGDIGPHSGRFTPIPLTNNTLDLASPTATNIPGSLGGNGTPPAFQLFGSFLDNIQVDFLLRATQVDRRQNDLDSPRLVLHNGQRATFEAFLEQDYVSSLQPVLGNNVGLFQPIINTALSGRSLDVQATVGPDRRYVTMTVRTFTQVSGDPVPFQFSGGAINAGAGFVQLIRRTTQVIRTTVTVPDGGTLLIGGLKQSAEREVDAGVPILSRIPVLKRAFSNSSLVKDDSVLLILIKPKIIIQEEAESEAFPTMSAR